MIFPFFYNYAERFDSRFVKSLIMLFGVALFVFLVALIVRLFIKKKSIWFRIILILLAVLYSPSLFGFFTQIEFTDKVIEPEYIMSFRDENHDLDEYWNRYDITQGAFIVSDPDPSTEGLVGVGDTYKDVFLPIYQSGDLPSIDFDFETNSYLFVKGSDAVEIRYSVWAEGASWYLGPEGFVRFCPDAKLDRLHETEEQDTVYVFKFPKTYVSLSKGVGGHFRYGCFVDLRWAGN